MHHISKKVTRAAYEYYPAVSYLINQKHLDSLISQPLLKFFPPVLHQAPWSDYQDLFYYRLASIWPLTQESPDE